jgi:hypothetical protein
MINYATGESHTSFGAITMHTKSYGKAMAPVQEEKD